MNMKKITAFAAAMVIAAGICAGVPTGTENGSPLAITAEAATKEVGALSAKVTHSGVSIDLKWEHVKNVSYYNIMVMYSTDSIPFSSLNNVEFFALKKVTPTDADSELSVTIYTAGLPLDINGKPVHYNVQIVPMNDKDDMFDEKLTYAIWFDSLDDLEKTNSGGSASQDMGEPQTTVTGSAPRNNNLNLPENYSATGGDKKIDVKWDKVNGAKKYSISYCEAGSNSYKFAGDTTSTSYTISGLTSGKAYDIIITPDNSNNNAVKLANVLVGGSNAADTKTDTKSEAKSETKKAAAPANIKTSKTKNSVTLTWDKADGAAMYRVYMYNEKTGKYEKYKDVKNAKCTVTGLKAGTKYKFKVVSYSKEDGKYVKGESSKAVSVTTKK